MDHPKKAAEKLLHFYQGDKLKELIDHLRQGLQPFPTESPETAPETVASVAGRSSLPRNHQSANNNSHSLDNQHTTDKADTSTDASATPPNLSLPALKPAETGVEQSVPAHLELTLEDLAKRLNASPRTVRNTFYKARAEFLQWSQKRDPEGIAWQKSNKKKGRSSLFVPISEVKQE
jgi:AraC-like DNA-binding protein